MACRSTGEAIRAQVRRKPNIEQEIDVERAGARLTLRVTPTAEGRVALESIEKQIKVGPGEAALMSLRLPFTIMSEAAHGFSQILLGREQPEFVGTVGIVRQSSTAASQGAPVLSFVGALGAYFLPFLVGVHCFDALSLLIFEKTHPLAAQGERSIWRLARFQQALVFVLGAWIGLFAFVILQAAKLPVALFLPEVLLLLPVMFAVVPLVWVAAPQFWGRTKTALLVLIGVVAPYLTAFFAIWLLLRVRRELRAKQFRVGLFVVRPLTE